MSCLKIPDFPPTILAANDALLPLTKLSITDYGLCTVVNGNTLNETYTDSKRTNVFAEYFDNRVEAVTPLKVQVFLQTCFSKYYKTAYSRAAADFTRLNCGLM